MEVYPEEMKSGVETQILLLHLYSEILKKWKGTKSLFHKKKKLYIYIYIHLSVHVLCVYIDTHNTHTLAYSLGRKSLQDQCKYLELFENNLKVKKRSTR